MSVLNKGRDDNKNPQDTNQANPGNDVKVNPDHAIQTEQQTESVWLFVPKAVEVDGITYFGEIKVAAEQADKIKKADGSVSVIDAPDNQHHGAKPMPKELDGPDYV